MSLTNEQIKAVLDGAPGYPVTHYGLDKKYYYWDGHCFWLWNDKTKRHDPSRNMITRSLADLREILALRQEVERLKAQQSEVAEQNSRLAKILDEAPEADYVFTEDELKARDTEVAARAVADACNQPCGVIANIEQEGVVNSRDEVYCDIWLSSSDLMSYANQLREQGDE